jgi:hypothetical protein
LPRPPPAPGLLGLHRSVHASELTCDAASRFRCPRTQTGRADADDARSIIPTLIIDSYKIGSENCGSSSWGQRLGGEGKPAGRMGMSDQFYEKLSLDSLHALLHRTKDLADKAVRPYRSAMRFDVPGSAILDKRSTQQPSVLPLASFQRGGASELRDTNTPVVFHVLGLWVAVLAECMLVHEFDRGPKRPWHKVVSSLSGSSY